MKKIIAGFLLAGMVTFPSQGQAGIPVTCINCSSFIQQILDSVTLGNELATQIEQYKEMLTHTSNQVWMIEQETRRLLTLPQSTLTRYTDELTRLARAYIDLDMYRGDISAMSDIFRAVYPDLNSMYGLSENSSPTAIQEEWQKRSKHTDKVAESLFKLSGVQLKKLTDSPEALRQHIESLVNTQNETQVAQAGNALSGMMVKELRDLNILAATSLQHSVDISQNKNKQEQFNRGVWERATRTDDANFEYRGKQPF